MNYKEFELVRAEIEILKVCQHPNIIRIYDVFENLDYIYISNITLQHHNINNINFSHGILRW